MTSPFGNSVLWKIGVKPECRKLLFHVNPNWEKKEFLTTEFYLDPITKFPEDYPFMFASEKPVRKRYIAYFLKELGWYARTKNSKGSVFVNPKFHPNPDPTAARATTDRSPANTPVSRSRKKLASVQKKAVKIIPKKKAGVK